MALPERAGRFPINAELVPYIPDRALFAECLPLPQPTRRIMLGRYLGNGLEAHARNTNQPILSVFKGFVQVYSPHIYDRSFLEGTVEPRENENVILCGTLYNVAENIMRGDLGRTAIFLYNVLEMTPEEARRFMPRFFDIAYPDHAALAMDQLEKVEGLSPQTLSSIFT